MVQAPLRAGDSRSDEIRAFLSGQFTVGSPPGAALACSPPARSSNPVVKDTRFAPTASSTFAAMGAVNHEQSLPDRFADAFSIASTGYAMPSATAEPCRVPISQTGFVPSRS